MLLNSLPTIHLCLNKEEWILVLICFTAHLREVILGSTDREKGARVHLRGLKWRALEEQFPRSGFHSHYARFLRPCYLLQPNGCLVLLHMLFLWPRLHVTDESGIRIRNVLNSLSRVEIFQYAMSPESSGR